MPDHELVMEVRLLAQAQSEQSKNIKKTNELLERLVESEIRREEREHRQEEVNTRTDARLTALEEFKRDIEIKRSGEAKGMEVLGKYWWILLLIGGYVVFEFTRNGFFAN